MTRHVIFGVCALLTSSCVTAEQAAFLSSKGAMQRFTGVTDTGVEFAGVAYFEWEAEEGRFCSSFGKSATCAGTYDPVITQATVVDNFVCTDGTRGRSTTRHVADTSLGGMTATTAVARMTDGRSAEIRFSPAEPYNGSPRC